MKILKLIRAALQGTTWFSLQGIKELKRRDLLWVAWLSFWGIALVFGFFIFYIITLYNNLLLLGNQIGREELIFFYATIASWVFIFLLGIPLALSVMYYSKDMQLLLSLPLKAEEIIISRIGILFLYCFPIHFILTGLAIYVYGNAVSFSFELLLSGFFHCVVGPFFPLSFAIVLVVILGKLVNLGRFKTLFEVGGMFLGLALIVGLQYFITRSFMDSDQISGIFGIARVFDQLIALFFPAAWVAKSFFPENNILYLFLSLLLYVCTTGIMIMVTRWTYLQDISKRVIIRRKKNKKIKPRTENKQEGKTSALIKKELYILFSNSTFIFQTVGELCIFPILLIIFAVIIPGEYFNQILPLLPTGPFASLIIFGVCVGFTNLNSLSCTSVSREGKSFALSLAIPIPGKAHIISKFFVHIIFYVPVFLIDMIILMIFLNADMFSLFYMIPGAFVFLVFAFIISITIDLKRPVLNWTHPMQAVKNNLNVLINLGISAGYILLFGFIGWVCLKYVNLTPLAFGCGLVILVGIIDVLMFSRLFKFANVQYSGGIEMD